MPRLVRRTRRRLTVRFGVDEPDVTGYTKNISRSGLYIETNRAADPGTPLQLQIDAGDRVLAMQGVVVWARRYPPSFARVRRGGMGCRFVSPSREWLEFYAAWKNEV